VQLSERQPNADAVRRRGGCVPSAEDLEMLPKNDVALAFGEGRMSGRITRGRMWESAAGADEFAGSDFGDDEVVPSEG